MRVEGIARRFFPPGLVLLLLHAGCSSPGPSEPDASSYNPNAVAVPDDPIGKYLLDVDASIRAWNQLSLTAESDQDRRRALLLEQEISRATVKRTDELIAQLESGPRNNRVRAAAALGFTHRAEVQGPLLAALEDPDQDVVHNALLGLAVLQMPDTPLTVICDVLRSSPDDQVRSNALHTLLSLALVGARSDCATEGAQAGLYDPEPLVRGQSALLLAVLGAERSAQHVAPLIADPVPFVWASAIRSLEMLGMKGQEHLGPAARALAEALDQAEPRKRERIVSTLRRLRGADLGYQSPPWLQWAGELP